MKRGKGHSLRTRKGGEMARELFIWTDIEGNTCFGPQETIDWDALDDELPQRYPEAYAYWFLLQEHRNPLAYLRGFTAQIRQRAKVALDAGTAQVYDMTCYTRCSQHADQVCDDVKVVGRANVTARPGLEGTYRAPLELPISEMRELASDIVAAYERSAR